MKLTESNSVNLDKPLAESAVAPGECVSVPRIGVEPSRDGWFGRRDQGMRPPNNQPNSDHVAVIGAKPNSVHLAVTSAEPEPRLTAAEDMPVVVWYRTERDISDEYFTNYSDGPDRPDGEGWKPLCDPQTVMAMVMAEQFKRAVAGPQSGVSSPKTIGQSNEQNAVIQTEQPSLSACKCSLRTKLVGDGCAVCNPKLAEELAQRQDSDTAILANIRAAMNGYFLALDTRQHGGIAQTRAFDEIQRALDMHWIPGAAIANGAPK